MIFSPYRICPLGAHIDHQGGIVLGRTLALGTKLEYQPLESREIQILSRPFGETSFFIGTEINKNHWSCYAQAAAQVLGERLRRGMVAYVDGKFAGSGLSSSASVGLAYLKALASVNEIELSDLELVQMDYQLENGKLGLHNGLLDPLTIVCGKKDALLRMDTLRARVTPIQDPPSQDGVWIIAYSGVSRQLIKSGYNNRVAECYAAASLLKPGAQKLSDVPPETFADRWLELPENLRRRAAHYFSEVERVLEGAEAWKNGKLDHFGQLMNGSCQSSIVNYETGSPILIELHEIASGATGVYGSRFSGGGYAGCVVALAKKELAENAVAEIADRFSRQHPELKSSVFVAEMGDGLRLVP